jgi:hypothetical protein
MKQFQNPNATGAVQIVTNQNAGLGDGAAGSGTDRLVRTAPNNDRKVIQPREAEVWVKKWVDYSTKYGLGYYLSNEATGVFFNDSTKVVLDPNGNDFDYMERRSSDR